MTQEKQSLITDEMRASIGKESPPQTLEVVASAGEAWILLGRDVLNTHRLVLDGPQLALEIG